MPLTPVFMMHLTFPWTTWTVLAVVFSGNRVQYPLSPLMNPVSPKLDKRIEVGLVSLVQKRFFLAPLLVFLISSYSDISSYPLILLKEN
jgi:hypothetical protein